MDTRNFYRPDIDGLRAIAVLAVMVYHLNESFLPGGYVGVDVFFVISGFVVTASLVGSSTGSVSAFFAEFYARRLARIVPALVLVLMSSAIAATAVIPKAWLSGFSESTARAAFFGLSNVVMQRNSDTYFAPRAEFNPYIQTWSLGVEEQFYLMAPLLVYFWIRAIGGARASQARLAIGGLAVLTGLSLAASIWATKNQPTVAFYFIGCRLWELASGALLFLITYRSNVGITTEGHRGMWRRFQSLMGAACIAVSFSHADAARFPWPWALLPVFGTLLIIGGARTGPRGMVRSILAAAPMVWIGKRSYSLYLWHWPVYVLMRWTVGLNSALLFTFAVLTSFLFAILSYRLVEQPLRHNAWVERQAKWRRIAGFVLLPIIGFFFVTYWFNHRERYSLSRVVRAAADWYPQSQMAYPNVADRRCKVEIVRHAFAGGNEMRYVPKQCQGSLPSKRMYVLGDSHAGMLAPIFEQISAEKGITVSIFSFAGCSYIDLKAPMDFARAPGCLEFSRAITSHTVTTSEPGDIVVLSSLRMERYGDQWASFDVPDMYAKMHNSEARKLRDAALEDARSWLQAFVDSHLTVIFVAPTPVFKAPPFRCSDWFNQMNPICIGQNQQHRAELETLRKPIVESMHALGRMFPNVRVWDPFAILCPDEICRTHRDGRPLFFDGDHLSAYGNLVLYPAFRQTILEME